MASRLLAQLLLTGGAYLARAFAQAYQQALVNSARSGGGAAAAGGMSRRAAMSVEEAANILGVPKNAGLKQINQRYERLFNANDGSKGGSVYLQAKIHFAKMEMERVAAERGERLASEQQQRADDGDSTAKR